MVFDFLGDKKKVVIAMAHIGALPGSPLYDADGGVNKLIEGVLKDIEALQTGGVDAVIDHERGDYQRQNQSGRAEDLPLAPRQARLETQRRVRNLA